MVGLTEEYVPLLAFTPAAGTEEALRECSEELVRTGNGGRGTGGGGNGGGGEGGGGAGGSTKLKLALDTAYLVRKEPDRTVRGVA
jgi:hypothetical protein